MVSAQLLEGQFYWAQPVLDADADSDWVNQSQPARYLGNDRWLWIGYETEDWPARWVGDLIGPVAVGVEQGGPVRLSITLDFNVPEPFERKTTLTNQQIIDKVLEYVEDERRELVQSARIAAIKLLNGEKLDA